MQKALYRQQDGKMLAGVCKGVANYLEVDVVLVRLVWVILGLADGVGVIAYLIAWVIMPVAPASGLAGDSGGTPADSQGLANGASCHPGGGQEETAAYEGRRRNVGLLLVVVGIAALMTQFVPVFPWERLWPAAIIIIGGVLVLQGKGANRS